MGVILPAAYEVSPPKKKAVQHCKKLGERCDNMKEGGKMRKEQLLLDYKTEGCPEALFGLK